MPTSETEIALIERIQRGDEDAFDEFVSLFGGRLYAFGLRICGEREDARDVAQETLLQAFRSLKTLKDPRALRSWLYRVASNACLMKRRRGKFEPRHPLSLEELLPSDAVQASAELPDPAAAPDDAAAREEMREIVRRAIGTLPAHYRVVLVLRDMEQFSTRETATALDLAESAVKMRLHRARLMVRRAIEAATHGGTIEEVEG